MNFLNNKILVKMPIYDASLTNTAGAFFLGLDDKL